MRRALVPVIVTGEPVVQPDGTVVVPLLANNGDLVDFRSTDGGRTWGPGAHPGLVPAPPPAFTRTRWTPCGSRAGG